MMRLQLELLVLLLLMLPRSISSSNHYYLQSRRANANFWEQSYAENVSLIRFSPTTAVHLLANWRTGVSSIVGYSMLLIYFISRTTSLPLPVVMKSFKFVNARTSILR